MKVYLIQTDNYWCAFDLGDPKGDKSVGVISRVDEKTGITEVLSTLDKHGIGLVAELADKLAIAKNEKLMLRRCWCGSMPNVTRANVGAMAVNQALRCRRGL